MTRAIHGLPYADIPWSFAYCQQVWTFFRYLETEYIAVIQRLQSPDRYEVAITYFQPVSGVQAWIIPRNIGIDHAGNGIAGFQLDTRFCAKVVGMVIRAYRQLVEAKCATILRACPNCDVVRSILVRDEERSSEIAKETTPVALSKHLITLFVHNLQYAWVHQMPLHELYAGVPAYPIESGDDHLVLHLDNVTLAAFRIEAEPVSSVVLLRQLTVRQPSQVGLD